METTSLLSQLEQAATWLKKKLGDRPIPKKAVILGSGFRGFEERLSQAISVPFTEIPHMPLPKVAGHGAHLVMGHLQNDPVMVLTGRVHMYEGHSEHQVVYGIRLLGRLGVSHLLLTNASGSVDPQIPPTSLVVVRDHLNLTGRNCLVGEEGASLGPTFVDMGEAYDQGWREAIKKSSDSIIEGVYAGVLGPTYETPAETRMLSLMGAHIVGMSTIQEVIAARQVGIKIACLSLVTNMAGGLGHQVDHQEVIRVGHSQKESLRDLVATSIGGAP